MAELNAVPKSDDDSDRIARWREERTRIAEAEKAERLRKKADARALLDAERTKQRRETARALMPPMDELAEAHVRLSRAQGRKTLVFWSQFIAMVVLPLAAAAYYLVVVATPLYEARATIAISRPDTGGTAGAQGLWDVVTATTTPQDVFMMHEYIRSQAVTDQLEDQFGFVTALSGPQVDPLQRLFDEHYLPVSLQQQFRRYVDSSVDVQSGLLTLYVRAPDAATTTQVAQAVLEMAGEQINALNSVALRNGLEIAETGVTDARLELEQAQQDLIALQIHAGEIDPHERIGRIYEAIAAMENQVMDLTNDVQTAQIAGVGQSNQARQAGEMINRLNTEITQQKALLVMANGTNATADNSLLMDFDSANLRVKTAESGLQSALVARSQANVMAMRGQTLFQVVVPPRAAHQPQFPKRYSLLLFGFVLLLALFTFFRLMTSGRRGV